MKTQEDLYLEYAIVIQMTREYNAKNNADVKPWECVKSFNIPLECCPVFEYKPENYTFAIAILEGKPVFVGDKLFHKSTGIPWTVTDPENDLSHMIWTPPQKKRTFMLNGVELECPKDGGSVRHNTKSVLLNEYVFNFSSEQAAIDCGNALYKLLSKARDKE